MAAMTTGLSDFLVASVADLGQASVTAAGRDHSSEESIKRIHAAAMTPSRRYRLL